MVHMSMVWRRYLKLFAFCCILIGLLIICGLRPMYGTPGDGVIPDFPFRLRDKLPPLTIQMNLGRLGNQMFLFATLFGISTLNGRRIQLMPYNWQTLALYFDMQYDVVDEETFRPSNPWTIGNWLREKDKNIPGDTNILSGNVYPTSFTFFHHVRKQIREIFTFRKPILDYAHSMLRQVVKVRPRTKIFIGVHVRRGDYVKQGPGGWLWDYQGREVDNAYFQKAMDYFHNKYERGTVAFLAVSDDRAWCRKQLSPFGILTIPNSPSAAHDLALLASCNHTIMTYGTFGFWGGYLSGGEVVYFADFLKPNTSVMLTYFRYDKMYPKEWVGISTTRTDYWTNYTNPFTK